MTEMTFEVSPDYIDLPGSLTKSWNRGLNNWMGGFAHRWEIQKLNNASWARARNIHLYVGQGQCSCGLKTLGCKHEHVDCKSCEQALSEAPWHVDFERQTFTRLSALARLEGPEIWDIELRIVWNSTTCVLLHDDVRFGKDGVSIRHKHSHRPQPSDTAIFDEKLPAQEFVMRFEEKANDRSLILR